MFSSEKMAVVCGSSQIYLKCIPHILAIKKKQNIEKAGIALYRVNPIFNEGGPTPTIRAGLKHKKEIVKQALGVNLNTFDYLYGLRFLEDSYEYGIEHHAVEEARENFIGNVQEFNNPLGQLAD
jgi:hypothetical protein